MINKKISSLEELGNISNKYRSTGKKIVLCHGLFDLLHLGHVRYFQQAKKEGDILIVTSTADEFCRKGPGRPVFSQDLRIESLAALEIVDYVAICPYSSTIEAITIIKPNIYAKGKEYEIESDDVTGMITKERQTVELYKGKVIFTDDLVFSSSNLLNHNFDVFTAEVRNYLNNLKANFSFEEIIHAIHGIRKSKVLVIGESIIDRYTFVNPLGQSGKGIHFAVQKKYSEDYAGGAIAVANHISSFVDEVTLFTGLGASRDNAKYDEFIKSKLKPNISPQFCLFEKEQTIVKERFIDDEMDKFFEVYHSDSESQMSKEEHLLLLEWLESNLEEFDIVVAADYGEGFITDSMISLITNKSKFLAINTQINGGNRGYHVVNRYHNANFISLNEPELRLASHNRHDSIEDLTVKTAESLSAEYISVTQGPKGLYTYSVKNKSFFKVPALSSNVVDRVGAGDAFLSISSICLGSGVSPEISVFAGAAAAAIDVQIIGNQSTVSNVDLEKYISVLLK